MFHLTPTPCSVHSKQCRKGWADSTGGGREIINSVLPCVLSEVRCGGGSVNCPGSPWNILITGHCWMLGVRFHGEIVPLSPCPGGRALDSGHWQRSVAILPQIRSAVAQEWWIYIKSVHEILKSRNKHICRTIVWRPRINQLKCYKVTKIITWYPYRIQHRRTAAHECLQFRWIRMQYV